MTERMFPCVNCGKHHAEKEKVCPHCRFPVPDLAPVARIQESQVGQLAELGITMTAIAAMAVAALNATGGSVNALIQKVYGTSLSTVSKRAQPELKLPKDEAPADKAEGPGEG